MVPAAGLNLPNLILLSKHKVNILFIIYQIRQPNIYADVPNVIGGQYLKVMVGSANELRSHENAYIHQ